MRKKMKRRPLKRLLKEQGFEQVFSLEEYEKSFKEYPTKRIWFEHPLCKYIIMGTGNGNEYTLDGDFSGWNVGDFNIDIDDELSTCRRLLCDLFGNVKSTEEHYSGWVTNHDEFNKWFDAIAA